MLGPRRWFMEKPAQACNTRARQKCSYTGVPLAVQMKIGQWVCIAQIYINEKSVIIRDTATEVWLVSLPACAREACF